MADILEQIVNHKRTEVEHFKKELNPTIIHIQVEALLTSRVPSFSQALKNSDTGIIAELKRKSPSKGWINEHCDITKVLSDYAAAGAADHTLHDSNEDYQYTLKEHNNMGYYHQ